MDNQRNFQFTWDSWNNSPVRAGADVWKRALNWAGIDSSVDPTAGGSVWEVLWFLAVPLCSLCFSCECASVAQDVVELLTGSHLERVTQPISISLSNENVTEPTKSIVIERYRPCPPHLSQLDGNIWTSSHNKQIFTKIIKLKVWYIRIKDDHKDDKVITLICFMSFQTPKVIDSCRLAAPSAGLLQSPMGYCANQLSQYEKNRARKKR